MHNKNLWMIDRSPVECSDLVWNRVYDVGRLHEEIESGNVRAIAVQQSLGACAECKSKDIKSTECTHSTNGDDIIRAIEKSGVYPEDIWTESFRKDTVERIISMGYWEVSDPRSGEGIRVWTRVG